MLNKRLVFLLLIIPFLINGPVLAEDKGEVNQEKIEVRQMDERAKIIQAYLGKYNSPMQYHSQDFIDAADEYDLDWRYLVAIAGVESTFGKFIPGGYNAWGWGVYGTQAIYFKSWREGMFTVSAGLRKNYLNKGYTDPSSINRMYSTSSAWGTHVNYFLQDMDRFQREYEKKLTQNVVPSVNLQTAGYSAVLATD